MGLVSGANPPDERNDMTATQNLVRLLLTVTPGLGMVEVNGELDRLGAPPATRKDLAAIGGYEDAIGNWCLPEASRSCSSDTRLARGEVLERHSHSFRRLGYAQWQAERNTLIMRWVRTDVRALRVAA
jgi:hypothetical protein